MNGHGNALKGDCSNAKRNGKYKITHPWRGLGTKRARRRWIRRRLNALQHSAANL